MLGLMEVSALSLPYEPHKYYSSVCMKIERKLGKPSHPGLSGNLSIRKIAQ
jgi:hypothetical protein